jgi:predicted ester cyclase
LEENKATVRRFIDAYNTHNLDSFDEFIAPDYVDYINHVDREGLKQLFAMAFKAFPDWHETIEDIMAEGDKVWIRVTTTGTHTGEWMGIPPTGKKVTSEMVDIYRIMNGKHVEGRFITDQLNFLKQLGIIEYTEQEKQFFLEEAE